MNVLIACEYSGMVREAFAKRGHYAVSCDLLPADDGETMRHVQGDVRAILHDGWDLMIAHPPCTHLASSGARWFHKKQKEQAEAIDFVETLWLSNIPRIALENPVGILTRCIGKPTQIIQPWQFGHEETKATCLWLKNLPRLESTLIVAGMEARVHYESPGPDRWKRRSTTLFGIADAMAAQWGNCNDYTLED